MVENDGPCWSCEEGEGCPIGCDCECPVCMVNNQRTTFYSGMTTEEILKLAEDMGLM